MHELVTLETDEEVAVITLDNPPVNVLSREVRELLQAAIERIQTDSSISSAVLIGAGRTFTGGADIKQFQRITSGKEERGEGLLPLTVLFEESTKPIVCAIHGTAIGGGLEIAMACHRRVALKTALVGQPEVKLGIIPGAGGTQRLPRLVGIVKAAEMCAMGNLITAKEAHQFGLIDLLVDDNLREEAMHQARRCATGSISIRKTRDSIDRLNEAESCASQLDELRKKVVQRTRGATAPLKAIEAVEFSAVLQFEEGCRREGEVFNECLHSQQSKSLIHVFFGERAAGKIPDIPRDTQQYEINAAAVVGAGTMGTGIAITYANAGIPVTLKEIDQASLDRGIGIIRHNYEASQRKGRLTSQQVDQRMALIMPTLTYDEFHQADIVVEAVFESLELKKQTFSELAEVTRPDTILASNTSTIDIDSIAAVTGRPRMVIGHHFFSPANVMRLLEIVRGKETNEQVIATSMALAKRLGKVGVLVGNCRGFVGNRMYGPYQREAQFLIEEGATVEQVDAAHVDFGMAMGPLTVGDLAGLDVGWRIRQEYKHLEPEGMRPQRIADRLCEMGRFGQKTGRGWYRYDVGSRKPIADPELEQLAAECRSRAGLTARVISNQEIVERTVFALINEGARIIEEGFALRAADIDIVYVNGYGFPAHLGGPMWYADFLGIENVLKRIREFEHQHGFWWSPAPLLEELARRSTTFAEIDAETGSA